VREALQRRIGELSEEIRNYPTPIARCDLHLPALLEERARLMDELAQQGPCGPAALWANDGGRHE
jgi:hypothetical protein